MISKKPHHIFRKWLTALLTVGLIVTAQPAVIDAQAAFDEHQAAELSNESLAPILPPKKSAPLAGASIPENTYDGVVFDAPLPTTFYKNETYILTGRVTSNPNNEDHLFAFINYIDINNKETFLNFPAPIINHTFSIPLRFKETGNVDLGIIIGSNGKSKIKELRVIDGPGEIKNKPRPGIGRKRAALRYKADIDTTAIEWRRAAGSMYRFTFLQGNKSVTYISRQPITSLPLRYSDFRGFKPGEVVIVTSTRPISDTAVWRNSATQKVRITYHGFRDIDTSSIVTQGTIPSVMTSLNTITIQGQARAEIDGEAYITLPDGSVKKIALQSPQLKNSKDNGPSIPKGGAVTFTYTPKTSGRYIVEINQTTGAAVINTPIYVATGSPLIPDYQDLYAEYMPTEHTVNLNADRKKMLEMINTIRTGMGLSNITLNPELSSIAQKHSDDMVQRNFFGHVNPSGETPEDRRKKAGFPTEVGENLANSQTLLSAMLGLLRSPIHRSNILGPEWTQVGIGIAKEPDGNLKITQEFAADVLTKEKSSSLANTLIASFNSERTQTAAAPLLPDTTLTNLANTWSNKLAADDEFGLTTKDGASLQEIVKAANIKKSVQMFIFSSNTIRDVMSRIYTASTADKSDWKNIGLGIGVTSFGEIKITILLSK